jgi:hypothetical protein
VQSPPILGSNLSGLTFQFTWTTFKLFFSGYLRFLNSMISSGVVQTYSNLFSIRLRASSLSLVAFET